MKRLFVDINSSPAERNNKLTGGVPSYAGTYFETGNTYPPSTPGSPLYGNISPTFKKMRFFPQSPSTISDSPSTNLFSLKFLENSFQKQTLPWLSPVIPSATLNLASNLLSTGLSPQLLFTPLSSGVDFDWSHPKPEPIHGTKGETKVDEECYTKEDDDDYKNEDVDEEIQENNEAGKMVSSSRSRSSSASSSSAIEGTNTTTISLKGEKRLIIDFENFGTLGKFSQTCCRTQKCFIPDGLCGTHKMYGELWRFKVEHTSDVFIENSNPNMKCVCSFYS